MSEGAAAVGVGVAPQCASQGFREAFAALPRGGSGVRCVHVAFAQEGAEEGVAGRLRGARCAAAGGGGCRMRSGALRALPGAPAARVALMLKAAAVMLQGLCHNGCFCTAGTVLKNGNHMHETIHGTAAGRRNQPASEP